MRVQCHLSEDEIRLAIAEWFKALGRPIQPSDIIFSHCTVRKDGVDRDSYAASLSYEQNHK